MKVYMLVKRTPTKVVYEDFFPKKETAERHAECLNNQVAESYAHNPTHETFFTNYSVEGVDVP